jgi:hypothetical protein
LQNASRHSYLDIEEDNESKSRALETRNVTPDFMNQPEKFIDDRDEADPAVKPVQIKGKNKVSDMDLSKINESNVSFIPATRQGTMNTVNNLVKNDENSYDDGALEFSK